MYSIVSLDCIFLLPQPPVLPVMPNLLASWMQGLEAGISMAKDTVHFST